MENAKNFTIESSEEEFDFDNGEVTDLSRKDVILLKQSTLSEWSRDIKGMGRKERRLEAKRQIKGMK